MASSKAKVEAEIEARKQAMLYQIEALGGDLNEAGESVKEAVLNNPFVKAGGALVVGLLVGLLVGKRRSSGPATAPVSLRQLTEAGVDDATLDRLQQSGAVVVVSSGGETKKKSSLVQSAGGVLVSLALREVVRRIMDRVDIEDAISLDEAVGPDQA